MAEKIDKSQYRYEQLPFAVMLMLSAGVMDAYSFFARGGVFANAQTGNIFLTFVYLVKGDFGKFSQYLGAVISFGAGIALAYAADHFFGKKSEGNDAYKSRTVEEKLSFKRAILIAEVIILAGVAFIPHNMNYLANCLTSFACGAQLEAFYRIDGIVMATTMCIGNYRSCIHELMAGHKKRAFYFAMVLLGFIVGAVICALLVDGIGNLAILVSCVILIVATVWMGCKNEDAAAI